MGVFLLGFRKLQSRPWTNLKLVGGPERYGRSYKHISNTNLLFFSKLRPWNLKYENARTLPPSRASGRRLH